MLSVRLGCLLSFGKLLLRCLIVILIPITDAKDKALVGPILDGDRLKDGVESSGQLDCFRFERVYLDEVDLMPELAMERHVMSVT